MKKIISVFMCVAMLFSFAAVVSAEEQVCLKIHVQTTSDQESDATVALLQISLSQVEDFESCAFVITVNEPPFFYAEQKPGVFADFVNCTTAVEKLQDGAYKVTMSDLKMSEEVPKTVIAFYAAAVNESIQVSVKDIVVYTVDGVIENVKAVTDGFSIKPDPLPLEPSWEKTLLESETAIVYPQPGDLDADGMITSSDARLCLRAAVGLEGLKTWQYAALAFNGASDCSSSLARDILRAAIGLDVLQSNHKQGNTNQEIVIGPFAHAGGGRYNWVLETQNDNAVKVVEKVCADKNAADGAPVRQYFVCSFEQEGTYELHFSLQDSSGACIRSCPFVLTIDDAD